MAPDNGFKEKQLLLSGQLRDVGQTYCTPPSEGLPNLSNAFLVPWRAEPASHATKAPGCP